VLRAKLLQLGDANAGTLQRVVPMHWEFGPFNHGRSDLESQRARQFHRLQCGSHPSGTVRPEAIKQLESAHLPAAGLRSKSWDEFTKPSAPKLDFVFTVCDNAAKEVCPLWPGQPMTAHWGVPDPAAVQGTLEEIAKAFRDAFFMLDRRISLFTSLPLATLDSLAIKKEIDNIGHQ
jgi:arsenate reductase